MNNGKVIGRYIYLCCGLIALIVLGFVVTINANEDTNEETRDVNEKYTIRRIKETINDVTIYYPKIEDMADKDVEQKMNENINEVVTLLKSMCENNLLIGIDYKAAYKGTDYLSFIFKGMMRINESEMEIAKSLTLDVKNGKKVEVTDLIETATFSKEEFKTLISNKLKSNGFSDKYVVDENARFYLEKNMNSYSYVFYFLTDTNSKYYSELRILKSEIDNALKPDEEDNEEDDNKDKNNNGGLINDDQKPGLQIEVVKLDNEEAELVTNKVMINNEEVALNEAENLYMYNNRIFVPLQTIVNKFGYTVEAGENSDIKVFNDSKYITLTIGEDRFFFGTENPFKLGEKTTTKNDIVFVPVEFFSALLNKDVSVKENVVSINDKQNS